MTIETSTVLWCVSTGVTTITAVVASHVRLATKLNEWIELVREVRRAVGMSNGSETRFATTRECGIRHDSLQSDLVRIESKLDDLGRHITEGGRA